MVRFQGWWFRGGIQFEFDDVAAGDFEALEEELAGAGEDLVGGDGVEGFAESELDALGGEEGFGGGEAEARGDAEGGVDFGLGVTNVVVVVAELGVADGGGGAAAALHEDVAALAGALEGRGGFGEGVEGVAVGVEGLGWGSG